MSTTALIASVLHSSTLGGSYLLWEYVHRPETDYSMTPAISSRSVLTASAEASTFAHMMVFNVVNLELRSRRVLWFNRVLEFQSAYIEGRRIMHGCDMRAQPFAVNVNSPTTKTVEVVS